jgi:hypothetical protein
MSFTFPEDLSYARAVTMPAESETVKFPRISATNWEGIANHQENQHVISLSKKQPQKSQKAECAGSCENEMVYSDPRRQF